MLHWQLLHWLKGLSLAIRVGIFSCLAHLFVLFALFVVYRGSEVYNVIISSTMINTDVKIVYMPLHYSLKKDVSRKANGSAKTVQNKSGAIVEKTVSGPSTTIAHNKKNASTQPSPKALAGTAARADKKKKTKELKVKEEKNASTGSARTVEKKKLTAEKKETQKSIVKNDEKEIGKPARPTMPAVASGEGRELVEGFERKLESPVEEPKAVEQESVKPAQEVAGPTIETSSTDASKIAGADAPDQNMVYVGQAEMEALKLQEYIQNEMAAHWAPPTGIRSDVECIVKIMVSSDGKNNQIIMEQPSKIVLFDSAARRAAAQLQPPEWAYGKEILITFKP